MKKGIKNFTLSGVLAIFFIFIFSSTVFALDMATLLQKAGETGAGFNVVDDFTVTEQIGLIISYVLSFLGVIFMVLAVYAGFLWMTAAGESDKIDKAKEIFKSAIFGLIIVLSANVITTYIINKI